MGVLRAIVGSKAAAFWPVLLSLVALDCATKDLAVDKLSPAHIPHPIVGDVVRFTLAYNPHAAMGLSLGEHSRILFAVIAVLMLVALVVYRRRISPQNGVTTIALALIGGGAAGNLIDRVRSSRGVVDFIDIGLGNARFWTFNLADAGVFCGAMLLMVILMRKPDAQAGGGSPPASKG
jgi:signal peptidase II